MTDMIDLMLKHTSVRRFTNRPIAADELDQIIEAGKHLRGKIFNPILSLLLPLQRKKRNFINSPLNLLFCKLRRFYYL